MHILGEHSRIIATGGGSNNPAMLQVLSDVFNSPVYAQVSKSSYYPIWTPKLLLGNQNLSPGQGLMLGDHTYFEIYIKKKVILVCIAY